MKGALKASSSADASNALTNNKVHCPAATLQQQTVCYRYVGPALADWCHRERGSPSWRGALRINKASHRKSRYVHTASLVRSSQAIAHARACASVRNPRRLIQSMNIKRASRAAAVSPPRTSIAQSPCRP